MWETHEYLYTVLRDSDGGHRLTDARAFQTGELERVIYIYDGRAVYSRCGLRA